MTVYYINCALIIVLGIAMSFIKAPLKMKASVFEKLKNGIYLMIVFGYMFALEAMRYGVGFDYPNYLTYWQNSASMTSIFDTSVMSSIEPGYIILQNACYKLFGGEYQPFVIVLSFIMMLSAAIFIFRFSKVPWISAYFYVTLTFFYGTMNYYRQYLALAVFMFAFGFLYKKKKNVGQMFLWFIPYLAIVLAAACFHKTALLAIPAYFMAHIKINKISLIIYGGGLVALHLLMNPILNYFYTHGYEYYAPGNGGAGFMQGLSNPIFVIVPAIFTATAILCCKRMCKADERDYMLVNMVIFGTVFWTFVVRVLLLERFSMYFYICVILMVPAAFKAFMPDGQAKEDMRQLSDEYRRNRKSGSKAKTEAYIAAKDKFQTARAYSISALVALMIVAAIYQQFGMYDGGTGFHGVFPYKSKVAWVEKINGTLETYPLWWSEEMRTEWQAGIAASQTEPEPTTSEQ